MFKRLSTAVMVALVGFAGPALADGDKTETFAWHAQATNIWQYQPSFHSPYQGAQSLDPGSHIKETLDVTLYLGWRPWAGAELWANPEMDQGVAISNTLGAAGYVNGEGAKVGKKHPYGRLQRLFLRQTFDLGGARSPLEAGINQLGGSQAANRGVVTLGKYNATDIFDNNAYAHDPKQDFLNWSLIDTGSLDYAADAWGYSYGAAVELYQGRFAYRAGVFDLSKVPNSAILTNDFHQFQLLAEVEENHSLWGRKGKLKLTGFLTRGRMGRFADAIALAAATHQPADTALVRRYRSRPGISVNLEQGLSDDLGLFARLGFSNPAYESYEYTDIDRSISLGLSLKGTRWGRKDDVVALGLVDNAIGDRHEAYQDAGGLGILIGDGRLPHPGDERIVEAFYNLAVAKGLHLSADVQRLENPAYNRDRGPATVFGLRLHVER